MVAREDMGSERAGLGSLRADFGSERDDLGFFDLISGLTRSKNLSCVVTRVIKMIKLIMIIKVIKSGYI